MNSNILLPFLITLLFQIQYIIAAGWTSSYTYFNAATYSNTYLWTTANPASGNSPYFNCAGFTVFGGPSVLGMSSTGSISTITSPLLNFSSHNLLLLQMTVYGFDNWSSTGVQVNDRIEIVDTVSGTLLYTIKFNSSSKTSVCQVGYSENKVVLRVVITHTAPTMILQMKGYTTYQASSESWGIRDVTISWALMNQCPTSCVICDTNKDCLECYPGYFVTPASPIKLCASVCPNGYYGDITSGQCLACDPSCLTCTGGAYNQCLTCNTAIFTFIPSKGTCECASNSYYDTILLSCRSCHYSCSNCANLTSCQACRIGFFQTGAPLCSPCSEQCESCSSTASCATCSAAKNRGIVVVSSSVNTCDCTQSHFERSASAYFDSTLTRADYYTSDYGACIACPSGCLECTNELKCTKCVLNDNRVMVNNLCLCQQLYSEDPTTKLCVQYSASLALSVTMTSIASASAVAALPTLILGNPAFLISFIDVIQLIRYILYVNVRYPDSVVSFFAMFNVFDASFIPNIVDQNSNVLRTSDGFYLNQVDGLFIRNSNQYILVFIGLIVLYTILKVLERIFLNQPLVSSAIQQKPQNTVTPFSENGAQKSLQKGQQNNKQISNNTSVNNNASNSVSKKKIITNTNDKKLKETAIDKQQQQEPVLSKSEKCKLILKKAIESFEWGIFLGCLEAAYLNITTFTFLQLQSISLLEATAYVSFFLSFLVLPVLLGFLYSIYMIISRVLSIRKINGIFMTIHNSTFQPIITTSEEEEIRQKQETANSSFEKSFSMVYSLFVPGQIIQQGYYLVVAARKFVFAFFLVFAYQVPGLILTIWILLNIFMIALLYKYRPYKEFVYTLRDIITEICFLIIHVLTYPFISTTFVYDPDYSGDYDRMGKAIIAFSLIIILLHLFCLIYDAIMTIIEFFKPKEKVPPTPIIPDTPVPSPEPEEPIQLTEYQKLKLGLRKQKKYIKVEAIHKEELLKDIDRVYFDKLQQLEDMMKQACDDQEFEKIKKQYDLQIFMLELTNKLNEYVKEKPDATCMTRQELQDLLPIQLEEFNNRNASLNQQAENPKQESQQQNQTSNNNNTSSQQQRQQGSQESQGIKGDSPNREDISNQIGNNEIQLQIQNQSHNVTNYNYQNTETYDNKISNVYENSMQRGSQGSKLNKDSQINQQQQQLSQIREEPYHKTSYFGGDYQQNNAIQVQSSKVNKNQTNTKNNQQPQGIEFNQLLNQQKQKEAMSRQEDLYFQDIDGQNSYYNMSVQQRMQDQSHLGTTHSQMRIMQNSEQTQSHQSSVQEPKRRKYQRQINPINASRLQNIDEAMNQLYK